MLEFKGKLSKDCKNYLRLQETKIHVIIFTLAFIVLIPVIGLLFQILDPLPAILIYIFCYIASVVLSFVFPLFNDFNKNIPNRITISVEDDTIISVSEQHTLEMQVSEIDKIFDKGDWYLIHFQNGPNHPPRFVCQKDLTDEETLKKFVELFKDKIVKKI